MDQLFAVTPAMRSHAVRCVATQFDYSSPHEDGGQLVRCTSGQFELFGHSGEWVIPAGHMVYIPSGRMFRIRTRTPTGVIVAKFRRDEVDWHHDGCWVGEIGEFAGRFIDYSLKWGPETCASRQAAAFFVTLGEMVPGWFCNERIMWTPYARNPAVQRVVDYANMKGPAVTLPEVARHAGMSERSLRRYMQAELGQSWRDFIRELRMKRAMEMLRKERKSIVETAIDVGFSSSSAFSHAFVEYVGKTPSAYARSFGGIPGEVAELVPSDGNLE